MDNPPSAELEPVSDVVMAGAASQERDVMNPVPAESGAGRRPRERTEYFDEFKQIVTRPENLQNKRGHTGAKIVLHANYITVKLEKQDKIFLYRVDFTPSDVYGAQKWKALRKFADDPSVGLDINKDCVFDRENLLYCMPSGFEKLGNEKIVENCRITGQSRPKEGSGEEGVSFEKEVSVRVSRVADMPPDDPRILAQLNTQLNRFCEINLKMARDREAFYDPGAAVKPQNVSNFVIWPGFQTSIGVYDTPAGFSPLLMCIDPKFRIVRTDTAFQVMLEARTVAQRLHPNNADAMNAEVLKAIKGAVVTTKYNNVSYRVESVHFDKSPATTFEVRKKVASGERETVNVAVGQHLEERYKVKINNRQQPLLVAKPSDKAMRRKRGEIWLVPELCLMTGYTDKIKSDFRIMKEVTKTTKMNPDVRKDKVTAFINRLVGNSEVQSQLSEWGTEYGRSLCQIPDARLLPPQTIIQRGQTASYQSANADWMRDIRSRPSDSPPEQVKNMWMMLHCNEEARALGFAKTLAQVSGPLGLELSAAPGKMLNVGSDNGAAFVAAATKNWNAQCKLIVAVFPNNAADRYSTFKNNFCCIAPCPTQVVLAKTIEPGKNLMSVATKVAVQLVAKLGGRNWKMAFPFKVPTMVIGIDTHRDRVNKEVVVAAAGSHDAGFSGYYNCSTAVPQARSKEDEEDAVFDAVRDLVRKCVEEFNKKNKVYPHQVFIYRDGISEGQLGNIRDKELKGIVEALKGIPATPPIKTSYVLVNKRDSTRFFENNGNPKSGTVVDGIVTRSYRFDFYIVSQSVREGTVAPTYYDVIHHQCSLPPDAMQQMTYMLCHMYFNWPGTIRVPAPCQYARKHAQLVALNLHSPAADALREKLFFL